MSAPQSEQPTPVPLDTALAPGPEPLLGVTPELGPPEKTLAPLSAPIELRQSLLRQEWKWWLAGVVCSFMLASVLMSGWPGGLKPNLSFTYGYSGDSMSHSWTIKRAIEGWINDNPRCGYPFGSNFLDYPGADAGSNAVLKLIGVVSGEYQTAFNLFFLLGFPLTFLASFRVARTFGLSPPLAFAPALLFDFLPFHFQRIHHLYYTWYFVVPIFFWIAFRLSDATSVQHVSKASPARKALYALGVLCLSSFGVYYALFGLIVVAVAAGAAAIANSDWRVMLRAAGVAALIVLGIVLNLAPNMADRLEHGKNPEVAQRNAAEAEIYGFKLAQLVLPRLGHQSATLDGIIQNYSSGFPLVNENSTATLGLVGSLGLFALFFAIFATLAGRPGDKTVGTLGLIVFVLFMFGTIGGFGTLFSIAVSPLIRGWNRISVFISFGALLGLFLVLQRLLEKRAARRPLVPFAIAGVLSVIGVYDQSTPPCGGCNVQIKQSFEADREFVHSIEASVPAGSAIYQLPYMPFPEVPPLYRLGTYDLAIGFLHSKSLRWSYGGMKGRPGDLFYRELAKEPIARQLEVIGKLGFAGIYIDRRGFEDNGKAMVEALTEALGAPVVTRQDLEVVFFKVKQPVPLDVERLTAEQAREKAGI